MQGRREVFFHSFFASSTWVFWAPGPIGWRDLLGIGMCWGMPWRRLISGASLCKQPALHCHHYCACNLWVFWCFNWWAPCNLPSLCRLSKCLRLLRSDLRGNIHNVLHLGEINTNNDIAQILLVTSDSILFINVFLIFPFFVCFDDRAAGHKENGKNLTRLAMDHYWAVGGG